MDLGRAEIMVDQFVHQPPHHRALLGVGQDREANVFFGDQHHGADEAEHAAAVRDQPSPAIVAHVPAERIAAKQRLRRGERGGQRPIGLDHHRRPHLFGGGLAEQSSAAGNRALAELNRNPARHIFRAHRREPGWRRIAAEFVAFVEPLHRPITAQRPAEPRVRKGAVGGGEALVLIAGRGLHPRAAEQLLGGPALPALPGHLLDQLAGDGIEDVVIGIARAEAGRGFDEGEPPDGLAARKIGAWHEQQIARAEP